VPSSTTASGHLAFTRGYKNINFSTTGISLKKSVQNAVFPCIEVEHLIQPLVIPLPAAVELESRSLSQGPTARSKSGREVVALHGGKSNPDIHC
jgi:hypothetical protein